MAKLLAVEAIAESYDPTVFFDEMMAEDRHIWIGGNPDFIEFNHSLYQKMVDFIEHFDENDIDTSMFIGCASTIAELDSAKIREVSQLVEDYKSPSSNPFEVVAEMFDAIHFNGERYSLSLLRGSSQGDWVYCIHPANVSQDTIDYLEAVYFGTGTEYLVTPLDFDPEKEGFDLTKEDDVKRLQKKSDIIGDYIPFYTNEWRADEIKKRISKCWGGKEGPNDVILLNTDQIWTETHRTFKIQ